MSNDPTLILALDARLNKFEKVLKDAGTITDRTAKKIEDRFAKINPDFSGIKSGLRTLAAFASVTAILNGLKAVVDGLSEVADMADRAQTSTDFIQALGHSTELAGGSMEDAGRAAAKFGKTLGDVGNENNDLLKLFKANGVSIREGINGPLRDSNELFGEFARLVANAKNPQEAMNLVAQVFGERVGPKMLTTIQDIGRVGLPAFIQKMREAGVVVDEELIRKGDALGDRWQTIMTKMTKAFQKFVIGLSEDSSLIQKILKFDITTGLKIDATPIDVINSKVDTLRTSIANAIAQGEIHPLSEKQVERVNAMQQELDGLLEALREANRPVVRVQNSAGTTKVPKPVAKLDDFQKQIAQLEKQMQLEEAELDNIDGLTAARERERIVIELETAAKEANREAGKKNIEATKEQWAVINTLADSYATLKQKVEEANNPLRQFAREGANATEALQNAAVNGLRGFEDALISIGTGASTAADAFKKMTASILQDIARLIIRAGITGPLSSLFSGTSPLTPRAGGGGVQTNNPYLVGERGPELFVPQSKGTILPNQVVSARGNDGVSLALHTTIDARGSTMTESQFRSILAQQEARLKQSIVPTVRDAKSRRRAV